MGKLHKQLTKDFIEFMAAQKVFFIATAPSDVDHYVNVSPRSPGTSVGVIDPVTVALADLSGSGAETASHLLQNGRMTIMFVNLEAGAPRILRLYGKAQIKLPNEVDEKLLDLFPRSLTTENPGWRAIYVLSVERITSSCGYSMPIMQFESYRTILDEHSKKTDMDNYRRLKNSFNINGLPSISWLKGGEYASVKPSLEQEGYVFAQPIPKSDTASIQDAHRIAESLQQTPARGGSKKLAKPPTIDLPSAIALAAASFATGFALCGFLQRRRS
mmetsp:Transcript_68417/g.164239  ORF Transcript_68417/g.164239 Transcript_68417/m.164239 type:complete len:273 (-) Transcript_68417:205-1023(-)